VRVPQELEILDFSLNATRHVSRNKLPPVNDLQGDLLARDLMYR
jgi:hypothetical protein